MAEQKIVCDLPNRDKSKDGNCSGVLAHLISPRMIQAVRQGDQRFTLTVNQNAQLALTCPRCIRVHSLIWRSGELNQTDLKLEEVEPKDPPAGDNPADPAPADPNDTEDKQ